MVPALMVILLTMLTGFQPALNIVGEKEAGTIEQINVTPVRKIIFILTKLILYWVIRFVLLTLCVLLAALVYGIYPVGSLLTIYLLVVSGMGLVISNYSDTMQLAMFVMFFFIMILLLMSGLFSLWQVCPIGRKQLQSTKIFLQAMRLVYLKGSDFLKICYLSSLLCVGLL